MIKGYVYKINEEWFLQYEGEKKIPLYFPSNMDPSRVISLLEGAINVTPNKKIVEFIYKEKKS
jgi:hypothetical protein